MEILIVEDHSASAKALARMLERHYKGTARCHIASSLKEGLEISYSIVADITILDLGLPDASVDEVIYSIPKFRHPVIVVTDLDDANESLEIRCYENLAQNFFPKQKLRLEIYNNIGSDLTSAITKSHWRKTLPKYRELREKTQ